MTKDIKALMPSKAWNKFEEARPYVTTSGFAVDEDGRFPILYRGPNVRSARNCWSLPSGLHEIGYTLGQQFEIELAEELNIDGVGQRYIQMFNYENISPADNWHWVINVGVIPVRCKFKDMVNKEPEKHTQLRLVTLTEMYAIPMTQWAPGLGSALITNSRRIHETVSAVSRDLRSSNAAHRIS
jgi:ADP-ribose pyrophosphatase YjhB (NUDIX family)